MATVQSFKGRQYIEPSVAGQIVGGMSNPPAALTSGNVMLIDSGIGAGYGGGGAVTGEFEKGLDSVKFFDNPEDAKAYVRGGTIWDLIDYLFRPDADGNGIAGLYIARAATTIAARTATITIKNAANTALGTLKIAARAEGTTGNGTLSGNVLSRGFGWKPRAGIVDATKLMLEFYEGQYKGLDPKNNEIDQPEAQVQNKIILRSPEFSTLAALVDWMEKDYYFNQKFIIQDKVVTDGATAIQVANTITGLAAIQLFSGGTTVYNATDVDAVLDVIADLDFNAFLADGYEANALSTANLKIQAWISQIAEYDRLCYVGAGYDSTKLKGAADASHEVAATLNSDSMVVVHSGIKMVNPQAGSNGLAFKFLPSIYHAAMHCGRKLGLPPQVPATWKSLRIAGLAHEMTKPQREAALQAGVAHSRHVTGKGYVINQSITSLQRNAYMMNSDGSTPEQSIKAVAGQLNKELIAESMEFIGSNAGTIGAEDIKNFIEGYLLSRTAKPETGQDNLILGFKNVTVRQVQDTWEVRYGFLVNTPINKIFYTGVALDPNLQA